MKFISLFSVCCFLITTNWSHAAARFNRKKVEPKPQPKQKPMRYDVALLPTLTDLLAELNLSHQLSNMLRLGASETQHLLRLSDMDFRIMMLDWEMTEEQLAILKEKIRVLIQLATIEDKIERPELAERANLKYGRVYVPNSVQSYEYITASFGGPPPFQMLNVVVAPFPYVGCDPPAIDLTDKVYVILRGECTFLQKAVSANAANASVLLIVNTDDQLESPSSGLGIEKDVNETEVLALNRMAVVSLANTTWAKFQFSVNFSTNVLAQVVPLKCAPGGKCSPVTDEEKSVQAEVASGILRITTSSGLVRSFDFLASTFGGQLPQISFPIVIGDPVDACESLVNGAEAAILVHRGQCRFDVKALNVQNAGGFLQIVVDIEDNALQRLGGLMPEAGYVGMPGILVSAPCGAFIADSISKGDTITATIASDPDSTRSDRWIDVAYTEWEEDEKERLMQLEGLAQRYSQLDNAEIVQWLRRRSDEIKNKGRKNIATDEL